MRRTIAAGLLGLACLGAVAGCSNKVSKEDFTKELTNNGIDPTLASCITDDLAANGFEFRKYGDLTANDQTLITNATTTCMSEQLGVDIPTTP